MSAEPLVQVVPIACAIDRIEDVRTRDVLPRQLTVLDHAAIRPVAESTFRPRREIVEALDALHDVAVVVPHDDLPAPLGRDLGAHSLADDPFVPEVIGAAVAAYAVGNHVGVEVVGVLMDGQDVLAVIHAEVLQQSLRIAHDLFSGRAFVFGVGDNQVIDRVTATGR